MNFSDLNIFTTTARAGSITKAARLLSTVQSNVTGRIKQLEDELGAQLFYRQHNGIQLTHKGQELLPYAQQILALVQKAKEAVAENQEVGGVLRIGSLQTTAAARLPGLLKEYVARHKKVDIAVQTGTGTELIERVLDHSIDGAFVPEPVDHADLHIIPAFVEELVMVTPPAYRSVDDYLRQGAIPKVLVFKVGCFYRRRLERYLSNDGIDMLEEMEFGTLDGIIGCISAGLGITMLPRSVIERAAYAQQVRIHPLPAKSRYVETLFITRKGQIRSNALERFMQVIQSLPKTQGQSATDPAEITPLTATYKTPAQVGA